MLVSPAMRKKIMYPWAHYLANLESILERNYHTHMHMHACTHMCVD